MEIFTIPAGYNQVMPYLIVKNAAGFIEFTKNVLGAIEKYRVMRDEKLIMHAEINLGDSVIMIADATDIYNEQPAGLFVYVGDCDKAYQKAMESGAASVSRPSDQQYGRSAGIKDKFGNTWWITSV
jgi:PhnB protein